MLALQVSAAQAPLPLALERSADDLKSLLIVAFETAIEEGLPPQKALSIVLDWVADECARVTYTASS